jgi:hypothetical protein
MIAASTLTGRIGGTSHERSMRPLRLSGPLDGTATPLRGTRRVGLLTWLMVFQTEVVVERDALR